MGRPFGPPGGAFLRPGASKNAKKQKKTKAKRRQRHTLSSIANCSAPRSDTCCRWKSEPLRALRARDAVVIYACNSLGMLGSAFEVFWFFAFSSPWAVKTAPAAQKGAPNLELGSLDARRNFAINAKNQKTTFLRPSKARPCCCCFYELPMSAKQKRRSQ